MANGITFSPVSPKAGDKVTVTVVADTRKRTDSFSYALSTGAVTGSLVIQEDGTLTHTGTQAVTKVSDDGVTAVYTVQY